MRLFDIIKTLDHFDVPMHTLNENELKNKNYCYAIVIPTDKLALFRGIKPSGNHKDVGVYVIDCDLTVFHEANKAINFEATEQIEKIIRKTYNCMTVNMLLLLRFFLFYTKSVI